MSTAKRSDNLGRRQFLTTLGKGAAALCAPGILGGRGAGAAQRQERFRRFVMRQDRFGRMFEGLPPFAEPSPELSEALLELGKPGGIMDANDDLAAGPVELIVNPDLSANNPDSNVHTAGTTFMGQFMDHDMTFDLRSRLGVVADPGRSPNLRDPAFDLDSVYGGGPIADRELYDGAGRGRPATKFKIESGGPFEDLPREGSNAVIADPRNDENLMIAGLHAAFLMFHNKVVDHLTSEVLTLVAARGDRNDPGNIFRLARQWTTWHYQWMILHEVLPLFVGQDVVDDILQNGRKFYRPRAPQIPVEFQGAAYRFGHSMVRPSYRANFTSMGGEPFFGLIFDPLQVNNSDPDDLRGGFRAERRFIGWQTFFDFEDGNMRPNKLIDIKISTPLFDLPLAAIPSADAPTSLPQRNLLRHITWQLPSGQSIAKRMQMPVLSSGDLSELKEFGFNLHESTPLWYYVLKEAEVMQNGLRLGPVGGRIVGEVIIGLLQLDRDSYLAEDPDWKATLPTRNGAVTGDFRMTDFLTFAGVAAMR